MNTASKLRARNPRQTSNWLRSFDIFFTNFLPPAFRCLTCHADPALREKHPLSRRVRGREGDPSLAFRVTRIATGITVTPLRTTGTALKETGYTGIRPGKRALAAQTRDRTIITTQVIQAMAFTSGVFR